ncbi:MAG: hypothetical protein GX098_06105 [Bacteroidales bacterium]|nr:hypothetical protein [Bacteroidales bacterium]
MAKNVTIMRRIALFLTLGLFSILSFGQVIEPMRITHGPWLQNLTPHSVTVMFTTSSAAVPGVRLPLQAGAEPTLIRNSTDGMIHAGGTLHRVVINGLKPGKVYRYRAEAAEILKFRPYQVYYGDTVRTKELEFRTPVPGSESVNFLVVNDIHTNGAKLGNHLRQSGAANQDLVFFNGDMIDVFEKEEQWLGPIIDTSVRYFASKIPFVMIRGNHETRGILSRNLKDYLHFPEDRYYFAFDQGPVHFVVLDCGEDKPDDNRHYYGLADYDRYRLEQVEWLKQHINTDTYRKAHYRVFLIHMPVHPGDGAWHGMNFLYEHFAPVIRDAEPDLMISGHTHRHTLLNPKLSGLNCPLLINSNDNRVEVQVDRNQMDIKVLTGSNELILEEVLKPRK